MTSASLELHVDDIDGRELIEYQNKHQSPKLVEIIDELKEKGMWNFPFDIFVAVQLTEPDIFMINTIRQVEIDGTDVESLTKGIIEGRRDNKKLFKIIKEYFSRFQNARIREISDVDVIEIRETRRIIGLYTMFTKEALAGKIYKDCIASTNYNFDLPDPKRPSYDPIMGDTANSDTKREYDVIEIPYRSLLTQPIGNLIVVCRYVSVEREVLGPVREMGCCMGIGQAAGLVSRYFSR